MMLAFKKNINPFLALGFGLFAWLFSLHALAAPACTVVNSDPDGDGWGWENNASCQVIAGHQNQCFVSVYGGPVTGYSFCATGVPLNNNWGYVNGQYCISRNGCTLNNGFRINIPVISSSSVNSSSSVSSALSSITSSSSSVSSAASSSTSSSSSVSSAASSSASSAAVTSATSSSLTSKGVALDLASVPLEHGIMAPPNVLLLADDSLSMDWELVISQDANLKEESLEVINVNGQKARYNHLFGHIDNRYDNFARPNDQQEWGRVAPPLFAVKNLNTVTYSQSIRDQLAGVWRLRNHNYNRIYYNPNSRYDPWPGYAPASATTARVDPINTTKTVDLTLNVNSLSTNNLTVHIPSDANWQAYSDMAMYLPMYYVWTPTGPTDTRIDTAECGQWIEIKSNAVVKDCNGNTIGGAVFPRIKSIERTDCADSTTCTYTEEMQNFANWFVYFRRREFVAKSAFSTVVSGMRDVNLGYATINADVSGKYSSPPLLGISSANSTNSLMTPIFNTKSDGGTPLISALDKSGKYFSCETGNILPGFSCPLQNNDLAACQQNYTVLITDGFWRVTDTSLWDGSGVKTTAAPYADNDSDTTSAFAGGAFADNNRTGAINQQWMTLADVAMYYFKRDIAPTVTNSVPPTNIELTRMRDINYWNTNTAMHQHMNTFVVGFGVYNENSANPIGTVDANGVWAPPAVNTTVNWPKFTAMDVTTNKLEDLKHSAFNGRGMYYDANNAENLTENLLNIFNTIRQNAGAVGAVSFNSQQLNNDSVVYAASYQSRYHAGDVVAYRLNAATGQISTASDAEIWRASTRLNQKIIRQCATPSDTRNIITYNRNGTTSQGMLFNQASAFLNDTQIKWIRGQVQDELVSSCTSALNYRARPNGQGVLGDVIHSRPLYVGPPDGTRRGSAYPTGDNTYQKFKDNSTLKTRTPMVMVGANDGMFHIFNANNGDEISAYVPQRLTQGLNGNSKMADLTNADYAHQYYVDLSPSVEHVFIKPKGSSARAWQTLVMGGYRTGGRGYFALNVTQPSDFTGSTKGIENVAWEFSDLDDLRMGTSYSPPLIGMTNTARTGTDQGNQWVSIFGNGYNSLDGVARLFVLNIEEGYDGWSSSDYKVIDASEAPGATQNKNGLSIPRGIDVDSNGTIDYVYAGDLYGNLYRFDLTSTSGQYSVTKIFTAQGPSGNTQPITAQPMVVRHPTEANAYIVVVATGSWITRADAESRATESIYGVVDRPAQAVTTPLTRTQLTARVLKNIAVNSEVRRVVQGSNINWATSEGWKLDLDARAVGVDPSSANYASLPIIYPGERAVRNMIIRGGYIFVNTLFPSGSSGCVSVSGGTIMAFNPITGLLDKAIFDFDGDGAFDQENNQNISGWVTDANLSDSAMLSNWLMLQETNSQGTISLRSIKTNTEMEAPSGRMSWTQLK